MIPPLGQLDVRALSGITGSISIAFWVAVFSPQILLNFRRQSAEGLSLAFLIVWLAGDVFNIVGALFQGVLPTMVILAMYYTLADIVLLCQCIYYNRRNANSLSEPELPVDSRHLSPATPLLDPAKVEETELVSPSIWYRAAFNISAIVTVAIAGIVGWYLSEMSSPSHHGGKDGNRHEGKVEFSLWGQVFGYLCAFLYLASRLPQILLNYKRKSCEGVSILFFLFAGIGNLTYVMSILAYMPEGEWDPKEYRMHVAVNASWLLGSIGTLFLDLVIFAQFFVYQDDFDGDVECLNCDNEENVRNEGHA